MKFLLVNDDGIFAEGLSALIESVQDHGEVTVIAPHQERSATSQAITVHQPLRLSEVEKGYMLTGTPTDCVKMGLQGLGFKPDFVLSGINQGSNLGTDVFYSGTVAAALESVILGTPAIAFSLCGGTQFMPTATRIVEKLLFEEPGILSTPGLIRPDRLLNINIPALPLEQIKGVRLTRMGVRKYEGVLQQRQDPRGGLYYWMGGKPIPSDGMEPNIDLVAIDQGYVSITPLQFDLTSQQELDRLAPFFA